MNYNLLNFKMIEIVAQRNYLLTVNSLKEFAWKYYSLTAVKWIWTWCNRTCFEKSSRCMECKKVVLPPVTVLLHSCSQVRMVRYVAGTSTKHTYKGEIKKKKKKRKYLPKSILEIFQFYNRSNQYINCIQKLYDHLNLPVFQLTLCPSFLILASVLCHNILVPAQWV